MVPYTRKVSIMLLTPFFEDFNELKNHLYLSVGKTVEIYSGTKDDPKFVAGFILQSYEIDSMDESIMVLHGKSGFWRKVHMVGNTDFWLRY